LSKGYHGDDLSVMQFLSDINRTCLGTPSNLASLHFIKLQHDIETLDTRASGNVIGKDEETVIQD
jgi:hypothetical protein